LIIADKLSKAGFSWGWVSAIDLEGRTIWIVDAHGYGRRFIVRAEEILTAFLELERAVCVHLLTESTIGFTEHDLKSDHATRFKFSQ
jgi:hypothetical protein